MGESLNNKLKSDFLANIMNHSKKDMQSIIVQEVLSNSANAEDVIVNSLQAVYDLKNNVNATNIHQSNKTSTNINPNIDFNKYNEDTALRFSNDVSGIFDLLNDYVLRVRFFKTNGEPRTMWATRNQAIIKSLDKQPKSNKSEYELIQERENQLLSKKIKVIDLEKGDWRVLSLANLVVDNTVENLPNIIRYKVDEYIWLKILNNEISVKESLKNYYLDSNGIVSVGNSGDFIEQEEQAEQVDVSVENNTGSQIFDNAISDNLTPAYIATYAETHPEFILDKLSSQICRVMFYKKDGSVREMWCTRNPDIIEAEGKAPKTIKSDAEKAEEKRKQISYGSFTVFDLSVRDWRRLNLDTLVTDIPESPIAFFDIDKALWVELFETTKLLENIDTTFNLETFKFNEESNYEENNLLDYSINGLFNTLIGNKNMETRPAVNVAMSQYLKQNTTIVNDLLKYNIVRAVFVKQDGSKRLMWCTRNSEIIQNQGFQIKIPDDKAIEIAQFEVYDLEAEEIRRLNIKKLFVAENEIPFMAFNILDKNWYKLFKGETTYIDIFNQYKDNTILEYENGNDIEFGYASFIFNSNQVIEQPDNLTIENLLNTFEESSDIQYQENSHIDRAINKEQLMSIFNKLSNDVIIIPNKMDIDFDISFIIAQNELSNIPDTKVECVNNTRNFLIVNYKDIFYFGVAPNGVYGMYKKGNSVKVLSNRLNKLRLVPNNITQINNILRAEFETDLVNEMDLNALGNIIRKLVKLNVLYTDHFTKKLNFSQIAINMNKDSTLLAKFQRVNEGINLGKTLPPRHKMKQTESRNISILPNGFIKIQFQNYVFYIGDKRAFVYFNNKYESIGSFKTQTSFNNEIKMLVNYVITYVNTNMGENFGNQLELFLKLYLLDGINLRFKGYFQNIESLKNN